MRIMRLHMSPRGIPKEEKNKRQLSCSNDISMDLLGAYC